MKQNLRVARWFLGGVAVVLLIAAGITPWMSQRGIWVDPSGSDTTGSRNHQDRPFRTIGAAKTNAQAGDTVHVLAGTYSENNILKAGVNYYFYPGAVVNYTETTTNGAAYGIFDDRASGATTNIIGGYGKFYYTANTNVNINTNDCSSWIGPNPNTVGLFVVTNALSRVDFEADELIMASLAVGGGGTANAIHVKNTSLVNVHLHSGITDQFPSGMMIADTNNPQVCGDMPLDSNVSGIYWELGETHVFCPNYLTGSYGCWANEPGAAVTNIANLWVTGDSLLGKLYISARSPDYRVWFDAKEMRGSAGSGLGGAVAIIGGGRYYIRSEKIGNYNNSATEAIGISGSGGRFPNTWITAQKISSGSVWLNISSGTNFIEIQHLEDPTGAIASGITHSGGTTRLRGQMAASAGKTLLHSGGTLTIDGLEMRSTNNVVAHATGAGLILKNCLLISKTTSNSIYATTAQNVGVVGGLMNTAKAASVTIQPGTMPAADANLQ